MAWLRSLEKKREKASKKLTRAETVDVPSSADFTGTKVDVQPFSLKRPKRRMLPKTPLEIKKCERKISGKIQIQLLYDASTKTLTMEILQAEMLSETAESTGREPNPVALIHILPCRNALLSCETETQFNTSSPKWNQTFVFEGIQEYEINSKSLEITLWNSRELEDQFLGEVLLDMSDAHLDKQSVWYNLEDHDENSSPLPQRRKSFPFSSDISTATSAATSSIGLSPSPNREASPSTTSLSHQYGHTSRSNDNSPCFFGKRRDRHDYSSSGQSSPAVSPESLQDLIFPVSNRGGIAEKLKRTVANAVHRVSSNLSLDHRRDYDSDAASGMFRRSSDEERLSKMKGSVSPLSRHSASSSVNFEMLAPCRLSRTNSFSSFLTDDHESDIDDPLCSDQNNVTDRMTPDMDDIMAIVGPGQVKPKASKEQAIQGELKLGFMVTKGQLEVDVMCAKSLHNIACTLPPDTYAKTYLVEGSKIIQKKKTHVVKSSFNPMYRRKIKYSACNIHGRYMRVNIWARIRNFDRKTCLGEALVKLDTLDLSQHIIGWYKLFKMGSMDLGSCESLNFW